MVLSDPQSVVGRLLADPPAVHIVDTPQGKRPGVWSTEESCYRFIASVTTSSTRSLETGSGLSTALFAAIGSQHICVTPAPEEADHLRAYLSQKDISADRVRFILEPSHLALPRLTDGLDLVFIDGAHGYPMPIVDWFYACSLLGRNGIVIVDDIPLPGVAALLGFLERDPRWEPVERGERWAAFRRLSSGSLLEGQWDQPFFAPVTSRELAAALAGRLRRRLLARWHRR